VSLDFPCMARAFFPEHFSNRCQSFHREIASGQIYGCKKWASPPSCVKFCALAPKMC
jgi:hypothetical protein